MTLAAAGRSPLLFGDHPAIDFANTLAAPDGAALEWLSDGDALLDWLQAAALIDAAEAAVAKERLSRDGLNQVAGEARAMRAKFRHMLSAFSSGEIPIARADLSFLTEALTADDSYPALEAKLGGGVTLIRRRRWTAPHVALAIIAEAIADLVANEDCSLVRTCAGEGCTMLFLDRTKTHNRRWCSMAICGNRAKVAAHRARAKAGQFSDVGSD
jgi:predicted RNA-binding Zn ribbon-like protein